MQLLHSLVLEHRYYMERLSIFTRIRKYNLCKSSCNNQHFRTAVTTPSSALLAISYYTRSKDDFSVLVQSTQLNKECLCAIHLQEV